ncbi:MAG: helix-turn-helix domain-containing protein [Saprospiraceae bacterium]|nr:helix-turn-helix domain-containing protein [Saprospiraceae bacterium]
MEFAWYRNNADEGSAAKPGLSYNHVSCFLDDPANPDRYIWIATKGGGLNRLDKTTGEFHYLTTKDGLPNNTVYGILSDDAGNIWGSTNRGIFCLSRHSNLSNPTFRNFTQKDGLQDAEFNTNAYAKLPNGNLAFGGVNGLTVFNPKEVLFGEFSPNVFITSILVNNEPIVPGDASGVLTQTIETTSSITLTHLQDILTLEFVSLDFTSPEQNKYRYQLVGTDDKWVESGARRSATYLHLPAGNYTFRVQGSNSRGIWSEHIAELKIRVLPPWWRTWWAYLLYVLTVGRLIVFIRKRELREREVKHRLELEKIEGERLKELDSFKSRLYTNLTHEFRTPLTVILGMAQQAKMEIRSGDMEKMGTSLIPNLNMIERNGKSLLQLINQLLDLSKLDNNALQLHLEQQDIVPYLRYVTEAFQTYANSKNLSVRFFSNFETLTMDFDPEQVKQVLTNLISNAVKFTPSGGDVLVKLEMEKLKIEKLKIFVIDTGIGIAEKDLPYVFDRFFQADSSSTRKGEGTGIGLAHANELVKLMGGSIEVKSEIGKGSTFMVSLPIQRSTLTPKGQLNPLSAVEDFSNWHSAESDESGTPSGDNYPLVLLVEDNADVVNYLKSCLAGKYRTLVARNGKIGVEMALEHIPDLLISDVMMPEMDGYEVCDALKNNELTSHIPILILTAKADATSRMAGLRRGADAYLSKPFDLEELLVQLEVLLSNQRRIAAHFSKALKADMPIITPEPAIADAALVEDAFVQKVKAVIEAHFSDEDFALPQLCQKIGMSRSQLFRKLKAVTDTSPSDLIRSYRLNKAKTLLETTSLTVSEVAWQVGFKNLGHFSQSYQEEFGHSPSTTRK